MALRPMTGGAKPARTYPNMNAVQGVRLHWRLGAPGVGLPDGIPVPIGTIPAGSFLMSLAGDVQTPAAGITLDIGTQASPTRWLAAQSLAVAGLFGGVDQNMGYVADDTVVYATLHGTVGADGEATVLLTYYTQKD